MKIINVKYIYPLLCLILLRTSVNCNNPKNVTIDITKKYNTSLYGYEKQSYDHGLEEYEMFVTKPGVKCKKVSDGLLYTIWSSSGTEWASEIIVTGDPGPRKIVEIIFNDGNRKYFYRPFWLLPWREFIPSFMLENEYLINGSDKTSLI